MIRPCFLVIDPEFAGSISTRKLVIETAKFNVITAYSAQEAVEALQRFPAVNGIVLDADVRDMPPSLLVATLKGISPKVPVVVIRSPSATQCDGADYYLDTFDPNAVLALLTKLEPKQAAAIQQHDQALSEEK